MPFEQPLLVVLGGPNGSGKTTLASYLIERGRIKSEIINPDEIASRELGSYKFHMAAARIALNRRKGALNDLQNIAFETTFSGNSEFSDLKLAKEKGYRVILYYIALESVIDNITRVEQRQMKLGHNVGNDDIIRRFHASKTKLVENIGLFDTAYLFDNSLESRSRVAIFNQGQLSWINKKHEEHPFFKDLLINN